MKKRYTAQIILSYGLFQKNSLLRYLIMKKSLFLITLVLSSIQSFSQITFEPGYFIDNSNAKTDCLIKNIDWENNPVAFEYKIMSDETVRKASIQTIKEFGIKDANRYVRALVKIDHSSEALTELNYERTPVFNEELLFLKVLVDGKASLYMFRDNSIIRYFYKKNDTSEIVLLIHKLYLKNSDEVLHNKTFQQQINADLVCENITRSYIENIDYERGDLEKVFLKYNKCVDPGFVQSDGETIKGKNDLLRVTLRPGLELSSLSIRNPISDISDVDFGNSLGYRFGIEGEFVLPFNKRKWSFLIEPTYHFFQSEMGTKSSVNTVGELDAKVKYQAMEIPIGIRHFFYLNDKASVYANFLYVMNFKLNSNIGFYRKTNGLLYKELDKLECNNNLALGIGFNYNSRFSFEFRFQTIRDVLNPYSFWESDYKCISFILGYSLF